MKKKHIFMLLGTLVILIGLIVALVFVFLGLYRSAQDTAPTETPMAELSDIEQYVIRSWQFHDCIMDNETNTVTAIRTFDLSYTDAQQIGGRVFTGDLAPETYLSQAVTIEADLRSRFSTGDLTVILSFLGNEDRELFRVDSRGNISTCWSESS